MLRAKAKFTVGCRGVEDAQDTPWDTSFQAKTNAKSDCECFLRGFWLRYPECKKLCKKLGEQTR